MEEEDYQKELFEFEKPKRRFSKLANIFPKADFEGRVAITLTLERIILILIGIIMLMVIIYALGVEKGKSFTRAAALKLSQSVPTPEAQRKVAPVIHPEAHPALQEKTPEAPARTAILQEADKPYTIAVVTFSRKDTALAEVTRLKKEGFDASMMQSNSYFIVCVGSYPNRDSVQSRKALSKVRQQYKDAYFKSRR